MLGHRRGAYGTKPDAAVMLHLWQGCPVTSMCDFGNKDVLNVTIRWNTRQLRGAKWYAGREVE